MMIMMMTIHKVIEQKKLIKTKFIDNLISAISLQRKREIGYIFKSENPDNIIQQQLIFIQDYNFLWLFRVYVNICAII